MIRTAVGLFACVCLAACACYVQTPAPSKVQAANLLVNPAFEAGNVGFTSGYSFRSFIDASGNYTVNSNVANVFGATGSFGDHTSGTGLMAIFNGATSLDTVAWQQTVEVIPGATYEFSGWIATPDKSGVRNEHPVDLRPADVHFVINGKKIGTFALPSPSPTGTWGKFSATWTADHVSAATIQIYISRTERHCT